MVLTSTDFKNKFEQQANYDVVVIGAGHAGCEAGLIAARMEMNTAMFCTDMESVAMMPCNPSIGGTGKGHLVREVDALGGGWGGGWGEVGARGRGRSSKVLPRETRGCGPRRTDE